MKNQSDKDTSKKNVETNPQQEAQNTQPPLNAPATPYPLPQVKPDQQPERYQGKGQDLYGQLRAKYPALTDADLMGTQDEVATRVAAKMGATKQDILNILQNRQNL